MVSEPRSTSTRTIEEVSLRCDGSPRARTAASVVEVLAFFSLVIGALGAIGVATSDGPDHPHVLQGIGIGFITLLSGLTIVMLAAYVKGRTE